VGGARIHSACAQHASVNLLRVTVVSDEDIIERRSIMRFRKTLLAVAIAGVFTAPAFAQTSQEDQAKETQRDVKQQQRIEQGLKSGELNSKEAGRLEREETRVDKMESHAGANGNVSPEEQRRINAAQNKVSHDIAAQKHDAQTGNPTPPRPSAFRPTCSATSPRKNASTRA